MIHDPPYTSSPSSLHCKNPTLIELKDFEVLAAIGSGAFGTVFRVKKKHNGHEYALKVGGFSICFFLRF